MKDRYLFRAQRHGDRKFVRGNLIVSAPQKNSDCSGDVYHIAPKDAPEYYMVYPETVGQCTGLRDKNGVPIFEGDICRQLIPLCPLICGYYLDSTNSEFVFRTPDGILWEIRSEIEVIGNIHDNPELIGGES